MAVKHHEVANTRGIHYPVCFSERDLDFVASCLVFVIKQESKLPIPFQEPPVFFLLFLFFGILKGFEFLSVASRMFSSVS